MSKCGWCGNPVPEGWFHTCPPTARQTAEPLTPSTRRCGTCQAAVPVGHSHICDGPVATAAPSQVTLEDYQELSRRFFAEEPEPDLVVNLPPKRRFQYVCSTPEQWEAMAPASESLVRLQAEVGAWTDKTFPSHYRNGKPYPLAPVKHLARTGDVSRGIKAGEVWELREAILVYQDEPTEVNRAKVANELADCQCLLASAAHLSGVDLLTATREKLEELKRRKWGEPDADGVCEHIREGEG